MKIRVALLFLLSFSLGFLNGSETVAVEALAKQKIGANKSTQPPKDEVGVVQEMLGMDASPAVQQQMDAPGLQSVSEGEDSQTVTLTVGEVFAVEKTPGRGVLRYAQGDDKEKIVFGFSSGHYGLGMVFDMTRLPEVYWKEFGQGKVIQIALGTMKTRLGGRVPQFAAVTVVASAIPQKKTTFELGFPSPRRRKKPVSLLMFSSPRSVASQSHEDKLQTSFFAKSGQISLTPNGEREKIEVMSGGQKLYFYRQFMVLKAEDIEMVTPFNPERTSLKGVLEFPLYWAKGRRAKALLDKLALQSLRSLGIEKVPPKPRQVSSQRSASPPKE